MSAGDDGQGIDIGRGRALVEPPVIVDSRPHVQRPDLLEIMPVDGLAIGMDQLGDLLLVHTPAAPPEDPDSSDASRTLCCTGTLTRKFA